MSLLVEASRDFVTVHDYVSAVHPWLLSLRGDILQAAGDVTNDESAESIRNAAENIGREATIRSAHQAARSSSASKDETGRKRGKTIGTTGVGDVADDDDDYETMVEWLMVTRSDPGGSVPRFMIERGTPPGIAGDANKFLQWTLHTTLLPLPSLHPNGKLLFSKLNAKWGIN